MRTTKIFMKLYTTAFLLFVAITTKAYDFEVNGIYFNILSLEENTVCVTYKDSEQNNSYSGEVTIPSSVTFDKTSYSVTKIDYKAFYDCNNLTSIEIPGSVTTIGNYAFAFCHNITKVNIPKSVTSIGEKAFISCEKIESITVESGNTIYDSRENCNAIIETSTNTLIAGCKNTTIPSSVTTIGNDAFWGCNALTSIEIPGSVEKIGKYAFGFCSKLSSINIPNSITSIGERAFTDCSGLTSVTIGSGVTTIGNYAFAFCKDIENITVESGNTIYDSREKCNAIIETSTNTLVAGCKNTTIPSSVTAIGNDAFYGCNTLTSIEIPGSVTTIGNYAFAFCDNITKVNIPKSVTSIGERAFISCEKIESITVESGNTIYDSRKNCNAIIETSTNTLVAGCKNTTIPSSVTTIGNDAFYGCNTLASIEIPSSVERIGKYAFGFCSKLSSINIPNSITSIGERAFTDCSRLTSVTIGSGVTSIGNSVFANCEKVSNITSLIPAEKLFTINSTVFNNVDTEQITLYVPEGAKSTIANTSGWNEITNVIEIEAGYSVTVGNINTNPERSITLPVAMSNSQAVTAFQIDLTLPKGVTFTSVTLDDSRNTDSHTISTSVLANGKRRIIAYSNNNTPFKLNEGTLLNINLEVPSTTEYGNYQIEISNIRLVKPNSKEVILPPAISNIKVDKIKGDANNDDGVTMGDVVAVANYILELLSGTFNFDAADINGDGEITMGDLVAIINIILYPEDYDYGRNDKRGMMAASGSALSMPDTRSTDEAVSVPVSLSSTMAYTAFQMDIELPEGAKLASATASERAAGHSVAWSCLPDGKMRVVAYSLDNEAFSGNAGELVALNIEAEGAVSGAISVENVRMVTPSGDEYAIGNCGSLLDINGTTGINDTEAGSLKVYTADGALIVESGKAMKAAVYSVSGKLVKTLDVAEGKNIYEALPAGTYIVAGVKVAIK